MLGALRFGWLDRWREQLAQHIVRTRMPKHPPLVLTQRGIFIVPTRQGYLFAFIVFLLLLGSMNYQLSLGFLLTFLLAAIASTGMLQTWRNLAQLSISPGRVEPVFAGQMAHFNFVLKNPSLPRFSVGVERRLSDAEFVDLSTGESLAVGVAVAAERRGLLKCGRIEIFTNYPLGLFHAWSYCDFGTTGLVYPKPDPSAGPLPIDASHSGEGSTLIPGDDEFHQLREYRPSDSPRHIAWKAYAREQGLLTKEFASAASAELWLDFSRTGATGIEERLSRLAYWVLEADRLGMQFGLKLPGLSITPNLGDAHRLACLEALALFGQESPGL